MPARFGRKSRAPAPALRSTRREDYAGALPVARRRPWCVEETGVQVIVATVEGRVVGCVQVRVGMDDGRVERSC